MAFAWLEQRLPMATLLLSAAFAASGREQAAPSDTAAASRYVFVVEDDDSLRATGGKGYREMYARAMNRLADAGAKSIALKYFFVDGADAAHDVALAQSAQRVPTLLQYALVGDGGRANQQPTVPFEKLRATGSRPTAGQLPNNANAMLPIAPLTAQAIRLGFVDAVQPFDADFVPLLGSFDGVVVESLWLQLLEQQYGEAVVDGISVRIANAELPLDDYGRTFCDDGSSSAATTVPLTEVLSAARVPDVRGKTVVFVYLGDASPTLRTGVVKRERVHALFMRQLLCIERAVTRSNAAQ